MGVRGARGASAVVVFMALSFLIRPDGMEHLKQL
jgi:hypothetical protein